MRYGGCVIAAETWWLATAARWCAAVCSGAQRVAVNLRVVGAGSGLLHLVHQGLSSQMVSFHGAVCASP